MRNVQGGRVATLGAAIALVLGAGAAHAAPAPVAVFPYAPVYGSVPQTAADKVTQEVSSELAASNSGGDFKIVTIAGTGAAPTGQKQEDKLAGARAAIAEATAHLKKGAKLAASRRFRPALENLNHGISAFLANFQGADDFKALSDAYVQLALTELKLGNDDKAKRLVDDLVRLDPQRVLSTDDYPKELVDLQSSERTALFGQPRGSIRVESTPAGAKVTIDGRDVGESPLLAQGALPGAHYVRVTKDGVGAAWRKVEVSDGEEDVSFTLEQAEASGPLADITATLAKNTVDDDLIKAIQQVGTDSQADYVVFGGIRMNATGDGYRVKSYAVRTKDGAIGELADLALDEELLSADIEVLKLVNDLTEKISEQTFAALPGPLQIFEGIKAPRGNAAGAAAVAVVVLAPPAAAEGGAGNGGGEGATPVEGGEAIAPRHRRGPVTAEGDDSSGTAVAPETPAPAAQQDDSSESPLEELRRRRERALHQQEAPPPKPDDSNPDQGGTPDQGASSDQGTPNQGTADQGSDQSASGNEGTEGSTDESPSAQEQKALAPQSRNTDMAALTPEDLEKMKEAEEAANRKPNNTLAIALGTTGGAIGAAGLAVLIYFLVYHPAATTATAHVSW